MLCAWVFRPVFRLMRRLRFSAPTAGQCWLFALSGPAWRGRWAWARVRTSCWPPRSDLDVRALETFAITVGQALALGAPLAETLAAQSREIRAAHRAAVEREIERAPVKLLIPTGTLILPALLLSILGPLLGAGGMM